MSIIAPFIAFLAILIAGAVTVTGTFPTESGDVLTST
jgi:hypothetical protein